METEPELDGTGTHDQRADFSTMEEEKIDKMSVVITKLLGDEVQQRKKRKKVSGDDLDDKQLPKKSKDDHVVEKKQQQSIDTAVVISRVVDKCHSAPDPALWEYERRLKKLATRGVVQLFNAVSKQQKDLETKISSAGSSERQKQKILKSVDRDKFLDMLKGKTRSKKDIHQQSDDPIEPSWNVLKEDYKFKNINDEED